MAYQYHIREAVYHSEHWKDLVEQGYVTATLDTVAGQTVARMIRETRW